MKPSALVAEFLGVFFLCFCGILAIGNEAGLLGVAFAHSLAIMVCIAAFGAVSGAHFNPAVSFAMLLTKRMSITDFLGYVGAQLAGGAVAALVCANLTAGTAKTGAALVAGGTPALAAGMTPVSGMLLEAFATFLLVSVIFGAAVDARAPKNLFPVAIGLAITAGILAIGPFTGAALNPARFIGPALVGGVSLDLVTWGIGPLLGAAAAAFLYEGLLKGKADEAEG